MSREAMGEEAFEKIEAMLRLAEDEDRELRKIERFEVLITE